MYHWQIAIQTDNIRHVTNHDSVAAKKPSYMTIIVPAEFASETRKKGKGCDRRRANKLASDPNNRIIQSFRVR